MLFIICFSFFSSHSVSAEPVFLNNKNSYIKNFPTIYNPEVERWIYFFSKNQSSYLKLWLKRSYRYFPRMKKIFKAQGLPKDLVSMSLVESSLSPRAISSAKAVGYWQFIKPTALEFGLKINSWIDERQDFERSTQAAASYLYKLYIEFEDWLLAMSAYNMGENRLRGLIKKHQTSNFWKLYKKADFPRETSLYVPKILAANHILKRPSQYGLKNFVVLTPYNYDIFYIPGGSNLKKISIETGISLKELKKLNPSLKKYKIPQYIASHPIRIPKGQGELFSNWLDKQNK
ncbi:MAG: lytic transglycosylase domain-containing protein [Bdellovibrionaceae bacterium]|nr:lytic transglycosylase domain-containing protein [Pseudobdellovibrionaceae bacterium]